MADFEEDYSLDFWWPCNFITGTIVLALFLSFLWLNRNQLELNPIEKCSKACESPNCALCRGIADTHRLKSRFDTYFMNMPDSEMKERVASLITDSGKYKGDILSAIYAESGYELDPGEKLDSSPLIWVLPGLTRHTFWDADMHDSLHQVVSILEGVGIFEGIRKDFKLIDQSRIGWKVNSVPSGQWRVYHLFNQGKRVDGNADICSFTSQLLLTLPLFMRNHVFGSAMFSVLEPGSSIEPHTGPCAYRLRCHLPLVTPPGYRIKVGRDIMLWKEGKVMVFDDSFVHEVWQEVDEESGVNGRAVFIFDIWHPQVPNDEQAAITFIYT